MGLRNRTNFGKPWLVSKYFPEGHSLFVDSGCQTLNTAKEQKYTNEELREIADHYYEWVASNINEIEIYTEFDALQLGNSYIEERRDSARELLFDKFVPVWHPTGNSQSDGMADLNSLAERFGRVGIAQTHLNGRDLVLVLNRMASRGIELHGLAMTKQDIMQAVKWTSVSSTSWVSPQKYGATFVWSHGQLKSYSKEQKEQARRKERFVIEAAGFDVEKILADDPKELLRLSLWSWTQFVDSINAKKRTGVTTMAGIRSDKTLDFIEIDYEAEKLITEGYLKKKREYANPDKITELAISDEIEINQLVDLTNEDREAIRIRQRELYAINNEYKRSQTRAYYRQWNPEQHAKAAQNRATRRIRINAGMTDEDKAISLDYRKSLDGIPCHYCGELKEKMHIDHFFPLAKDGTDHWYNLVPACAECNLSKGTTCGTKFSMKSGTIVTTSLPMPEQDNSENYADTVGGVIEPVRKTISTVARRNPEEMQVIPLLAFEGKIQKKRNPETGQMEDEQVSLLRSRSDSMRLCDTCFLADKCPKFEESANCAYNIPITIRTKDQMQALMDTLVEIQAQRVLFMKMAEDAEGGHADPILSAEIDRLMKMAKTKHDIEQEGFSLTISAKQNGQSGIVDKIFGGLGDTGKLRELEAPQQPENLAEQLGIIDGEFY